MKDVTKEIAMTADYFLHRTRLKKDNTPVGVRRTGKTQTWKTRPDHFKVPVKYGLYDSMYITHENCHEWQVED